MGRSGQPPQRKLYVLHQTAEALAKVLPTICRGALSRHHNAAIGHRPAGAGSAGARRSRRPRRPAADLRYRGHVNDSRLLSRVDLLIAAADNALRVLAGAGASPRPEPPQGDAAAPLTDAERRLSGALMRINHVGEVCAQALYSAQALATGDAALRARYVRAARDETEHLAWTRQRLRELGAHPSLLNPLWYAGAFGIGFLAGRADDATGLGFVAETERQVERHLDGHLDRLPVADTASRAIVERMKADEARHAAEAEHAGARELPAPLRWARRAAARVMTRTAHFV